MLDKACRDTTLNRKGKSPRGLALVLDDEQRE